MWATRTADISLSTCSQVAPQMSEEEVQVSRLEALVVASASRLGVDELVLLCTAILLLLLCGAGVVLGTHLVG